MKLCFIPNIGTRRKNIQPAWGAEFFRDAFIEHSPFDVSVETSLDNLNDYDCIWVHNVANLLKGVRGRLDLGIKLAKKHPPIIGGVRGEVGFDAARQYLRFFDALHTSNDKLTDASMQYNKKSYTLSSGVKPEWYKSFNSPSTFTVGWAGDPEKNMKNVDLLNKLDVPLLLATKQNYIPHNDMPEQFYSKISTLVHPSSHEGSNRVITEAAAFALPIICTDVGHNSTIIHRDWMISLTNFPVAKIKHRLNKLRDPFVAKQVGEDNQTRARQYSWPRVIQRTTEIINGVMGK